jgi:hypothetical protein
VALINCPECNKEISDKAGACPTCGFPITQEANKGKIKLECPTFPADLSIGASSGLFSCFAEGTYSKSENLLPDLPDGTVHIYTHDRGIKICTGSLFRSQVLSIHVSQLINISEISEAELIQHNKSVVGRAAVGALLCGPFGAVVGGLSGLNNTKYTNKNILIISFWSIETRSQKSIFVRSEESLIPFVKNTKTKLGLPL